jgi:hypothetical protein
MPRLKNIEYFFTHGHMNIIRELFYTDTLDILLKFQATQTKETIRQKILVKLYLF